MPYAVKEVYLSIQGEGAQVGRAAVFCRFAGCNLWSGREDDRATAKCSFCDTDFVGTDGPGGGRFATASELAHHIANLSFRSSGETGTRLVIFTGGEPLLQLDSALTKAMHILGFEVAVETNGTMLPPEGVDWICCSPKAGGQLVLRSGHELKLIFPQVGLAPTELETLDFGHFFLQPMDGPNLVDHTRQAIEYCLRHPRWRLSLQLHKHLDLR